MEDKARLASQINATFPVAVVSAERQMLRDGRTASGKLKPNKLMYLISNTRGNVIELKKRRGDYVKKGDVIAKLDDTPLQNQLSLAEASLEKMEKDKSRMENLLEGEAVTKRQVEDIQLGRKKAETNVSVLEENIDKTSIKSPMSGHLSMLFIEQGSFVGGGMKIAEIVDVSRLKLVVRVSEEVVVKLKKGQKVKVKVDVFPEEEFNAAISLIAVKADYGGKYQIEITLSGMKNLPLKAGMFARAYFGGEERKALVIPRKAIIGSIQYPKVYVIKEGKANLRNLQTGFHDSEKVEVTKGLEEGEQVVVNGQINLTEGTKVVIFEKPQLKNGSPGN